MLMDTTLAATGLVVVLILLVILLAAAVVSSFVFWAMMIIDCAHREFDDGSKRVVWMIVLVFSGQIGAAIYYYFVKRRA